jgi:hypothetical protein
MESSAVFGPQGALSAEVKVNLPTSWSIAARRVILSI